jgi:outer membrane protein
VEQAVAISKDATEGRRAEELRRRTAVTQAHDDLITRYQVIEIEATNRALAEERLTMARQRYALGAANIIELLDAQASLQSAERDWLNARYDFQVDLTRLEAASGVRLRPDTE